MNIFKTNSLRYTNLALTCVALTLGAGSSYAVPVHYQFGTTVDASDWGGSSDEAITYDIRFDSDDATSTTDDIYGDYYQFDTEFTVSMGGDTATLDNSFLSIFDYNDASNYGRNDQLRGDADEDRPYDQQLLNGYVVGARFQLYYNYSGADGFSALPAGLATVSDTDFEYYYSYTALSNRRDNCYNYGSGNCENLSNNGPIGDGNYSFNNYSNDVPEPASLALLSIGFAAMGMNIRRRKFKA